MATDASMMRSRFACDPKCGSRMPYSRFASVMQCDDRFDLDELRRIEQPRDLDGRGGRGRVAEMLVLHLSNDRHVVGVPEEHRDLDDVLQAGAGRVAHLGETLEHPIGLLCD